MPAMHDPYYVRPPDYRYTLVSEPAYGWWTGTITGNEQMLLGPVRVLVFDEDGNLRRTEETKSYPIPAEWEEIPPRQEHGGVRWIAEAAFKDGPILVKRFWLPDLWMGIEDLPDGLAEFYTSPETFESEPEDVEWWIEVGQYVFHAGCGDYYMNREGGVESS